MSAILSLILGGGRGTRLYPLTKNRAKPAVPVGGKYRLIDIPISNCINSELREIFVLTQFLSASLHRHIANTYKFDMFSSGFVEILAAQQTYEKADWYQGTADAVRQNMRYFQDDTYSDVLVLSGDQLYRMDFRKLIREHRDNDADMTMAVIPVRRDQVAGFGILSVDSKGRITAFAEKPKTDAAVEPFFVPGEWMEKQGINPAGRHYLANMGIYLFKRQVLVDVLNEKPPATDFGHEVFPRGLGKYRMQAYVFDGYWEDLGTIKSYHEASMALAAENPPFRFHAPEGVIYTRMRYLPASRVLSATLENSLISDGCLVLPGAKIEASLIGLRSRIGRGVHLRRTVVIGADSYETDEERAANERRGVPHLGIGDGSVIENAILDKDARVGRNVRILNRAGRQEFDAENYSIRDGIVVVPRRCVIPDNTEI
ncbi:MAG TPA: glucose-1-phosphate adenylyltransferase [Gemmataceae bacterium]